MMWLSRYRRILGALTLLMLFAPASAMAADAVTGTDAHRHMHSESHSGTTGFSGADTVGHDRMLCSILIPCEHGFCAGLALVPSEASAVAIKVAWNSAGPRRSHPAVPESHSPPPRHPS